MIHDKSTIGQPETFFICVVFRWPLQTISHLPAYQPDLRHGSQILVEKALSYHTFLTHRVFTLSVFTRLLTTASKVHWIQCLHFNLLGGLLHLLDFVLYSCAFQPRAVCAEACEVPSAGQNIHFPGELHRSLPQLH